MTADEVNDYYLQRAIAMFDNIVGRTCIHVDASTKEPQVCKRIYDLRVEEGVVLGECEWVSPCEERPDSLTDGLAIGADLLDVGIDWWLDLYFDWYLVFSFPLVEKAVSGNLTWVDEFLGTTVRNRTVPRPPPESDGTHLLPDLEALRFYG